MSSAVNVSRNAQASLLLLAVISLAACGGGDATQPSGTAPYSIGGEVTGITADGTLTISNNNGNYLVLRADTTYAFSRKIANGGTFQVAVVTHPDNQICTVSNGSGSVSGDVTNVNITCSTPVRYSIGGSVSGLNGSLTLINNGGDVVTLSANGVYAFPAQLVSGASYQVVMHDEPANQDCVVVNGAGTIGGNVANVNVSCISDSWSHPASLAANISQDAADAINPQVVMDGNGNAIAVWVQLDGNGDQQVFMSDYNLTTPNAWTHPFSLADNISPDGTNAFNPKVAIGVNGANNDAVIVWAQKNGAGQFATTQVFMSEYRAGTWQHPASLTDSINPAGSRAFEDPTVAMDDNGNAIIAWRQLDGPILGVDFPLLYVSEYRAGSWAHPANLAASFSQAANEVRFPPDVAMDNNGNAIVAWRQYSGGGSGQFLVYRREYRSGSWSAVPNVATDSISPIISGSIASGPKVAMDNSGNAIIVWNQAIGEPQPHPYFPSDNPADDPVEITHIFKSEYRSGVWVDPANQFDNISPNGLNALAPQVAMDNNGQAMITWVQADPQQKVQLFKSEYRGSAWTHPASLTDNISPDSQGVASHALAMDDSGSAIITWLQFDGSRYQTYKSEYRAAVWRHPVSLLDSINPGITASVSTGPALAMDGAGDALILWSQSDADTALANQQVFMSELR